MGEATQQTLRRTAQATGKDVSLWYRPDFFSAAGGAGLSVVIMTGRMAPGRPPDEQYPQSLLKV